MDKIKFFNYKSSSNHKLIPLCMEGEIKIHRGN